MSQEKFQIIGLGEILWDIYENEKFLGGAPANFAIHSSQLGNQGIVLSRIGNDELGGEILQALRQRNIETKYLQIDAVKPTGTVQVNLDEKGKPHFICHTDVAFDYLEVDEASENLVHNSNAVLFGTLAQRNSTSRKTIQNLLRSANDILKIFDINIRGWNDETRQIVVDCLKIADIVKLNDDELHLLQKEFSPSLEQIEFLKKLIHDYELKIAALTLGEQGCILTDGINLVRSEGIKVDVQDTTGCGDAFAAAMVHQYLRGKNLAEIANFANAVGAFIARFKGATPRYSLDDINKFVKRYF